MLTRRQQRRAIALWNRGDDGLVEIAAAIGSCVDTVHKHLAAQPGFPGYIGKGAGPCAVCGVQFQGHGGQRYCSDGCRAESARRRWWRCKARKRGVPADQVPPRRAYRNMHMLPEDAAVQKIAGEEARERGVPVGVVLREWKFQPRRSASCVPNRAPSWRKLSSASSS